MARLARHLGALAVFAAAAVYQSWPLAAHLGSRFPGLYTEGGNNAWNLWMFHRLVSGGENPLWTDFQYWPYGANLILPHYTLAADLLGYPLIQWLGLTVAHNLLYLSCLVLAGYGLFLLLREWGAPWGTAVAGGLFFELSPAMTLHMLGGRGIDYISLHTIALFAWAVARAIRRRGLLDALAAALCLTWAWASNYYYFLSCLLWLPMLWLFLERPAAVSLSARDGRFWARVRAAIALAAGIAGGLALVSLARGQIQFRGSGSIREILLYMAPYLAFWGFAGLWAAARWKPSFTFRLEALRPKALWPYAAVIVLWAAANLPLIYSVLTAMAGGDYGAPGNRWRGGGNPVDPAMLLLPNTFHPWWGNAIVDGLAKSPFGAPDHAAAPFGLTALLLGVWLWRRRPADAWVRAWFASFLFFAVLVLGPWLKLLGVHLYLPMPFYALHTLPVFVNMPNGIYFLVPAAVFLAALAATALGELWRTLPAKRWVPIGIAALAALELAHRPLPLWSLEDRPVLVRLGPRPEGAMLTVPAYSNFHIIDKHGTFGREIMNPLTAQIVHQKPIVGGFLGRVARRVYEWTLKDPVFTALLKAQDGGDLAPILQDRFRLSRYFRDMKVRYVLAEPGTLPESLRQAMKAWPMKKLDEEGGLALYEAEPPLPYRKPERLR